MNAGRGGGRPPKGRGHRQGGEDPGRPFPRCYHRRSIPELFYAAWTTPAEAPPGLESECSGLSTSETWPDCVPSGLRHPLVDTEGFQRFATAQEGVGPFRWCVNRFVIEGSWP